MLLAYVSPLGRALVDKRLYLPKSWTSDRERCQAAGMPEKRLPLEDGTGLGDAGAGLGSGPSAVRMGGGDDAVLPGLTSGPGDTLRPARSGELHGVAGGARAGAAPPIRDRGVPASPSCTAGNGGR